MVFGPSFENGRHDPGSIYFQLVNMSFSQLLLEVINVYPMAFLSYFKVYIHFRVHVWFEEILSFFFALLNLLPQL
jgi:hypothetical protein